MKRVLFVCLGNICRSPMAEAIFAHRLAEEGLDQQISVDSAGTSSWEKGNPPHPGTQRMLRKAGISYSGIVSRKITMTDFDSFDWIIGMDEMNMADLAQLSNGRYDEKLHLFLRAVPGLDDDEVPDPYYTGDYELTFQLISEGVEAWLDIFREKA